MPKSIPIGLRQGKAVKFLTQIPVNCVLLLSLSCPIPLSCSKLDNRINERKLACGEGLPLSENLVKVVSARKTELLPGEFEVLTWDSSGTLYPAELSSRGCFAAGENQDYIVRSKNLGEARRVSAEDLNQSSSIQLLDATKSSAGISCRREYMNRESNILEAVQWQGKSNQDSFEVRWSILSETSSEVVAEGVELLTSENYQAALRPLPRDLPDGSYKISMTVHNLLRDQTSAEGSCQVKFDSQLPQQSLALSRNRETQRGAFASVIPGSDIKIESQDASPTKTFVCMQELPDIDAPALGVAAPELGSCEWQSIPGRISAPASGYWRLQFKSVDAAGNESEISTQDIYSYNQQAIDLILELAKGIDSHMKGDGDPLEGVYNALKVENLRRSLKTRYEESQAEGPARQALYGVLHKPYPFRVMRIEGTPLGVTVSPSEEYFVVWTNEKGSAYLFKGDGTLVWKRELGEVGARATFSPDSSQFALAGEKGTVKIWSVESGEELYQFKRGTKPWIFKYRQDGQALGYLGNDMSLAVWDMKASSGSTEVKVFEEKFPEEAQDFSWSEQQEFTVAAGKELRFYGADFVKKDPPSFPVVSTAKGVVSAITELSGGYRFVMSQDEEQLTKNSNPALTSTSVSILSPDLKVLASDQLPGYMQRYRQSPDGKHFVISGRGLEGIAILQDWTALSKTEGDGTFGGRLFINNTTPKEMSAHYWSKDSSRFVSTSFSGEMTVNTIDGKLVSRVAGQNTNLFGPAAILPSHNLFVTGGQNRMVRFWDLESRLFPSYYTQGIIAQHSMNSDQSKHLLVERTALEYRIQVLDAAFKPLHTWTLPASESLLKYPAKDFSPLFRSFRLLDDDKVLTGDFLKRAVYTHLLDGRTMDPSGVALPTWSFNLEGDSPLTSFAPLPSGEAMVAGFGNGVLQALEGAERSVRFTSLAHQKTEDFRDDDMGNGAVLNIDVTAEGDIFSTGMDGRLLQHDLGGEVQEHLKEAPRMNIYRRYADGGVLIGGRGMAELRYYKDQNTYPTRILDNVDFRLSAADASPGGKTLAAGFAQGLGLLRIWGQDGKLRDTLDLFIRSRVSTVSFTPDGEGLYAAGFNRLYYVPLDTSLIYQKLCTRLEAQLLADRSRDEICPEIVRP